MSQIRLRIVGESVIELGSKRITPTSPQMFALLLFLGTEHDREVPRSQLIDLLYPASEPSGDSLHRLRQLLYKLRGMGAPFVLGDGTVRLDGKYVRNEVTELLSAGWDVRREQIARGFEVLPLYVPPTDSSLSEWVEQLREKLHSALRQQLARDIEVARQKADWRYLEAIARRTLELDPLNESAVLALAEATARTGSKARAISILDTYRAELGETRSNLALPAALLEKRINASHTHLPSGRRDPVPLIGRERELESLLSQWQSARRGDAQSIWLTGNKSVGKSRLAAELARSALLSGSGQVVSFSMSPMDEDRPLSLFAILSNRLSVLPGAAGCDPSSLQSLGRLSGSIALPSAVNPDNRNSTYSDAALRNALCDLVMCVCDERSLLVVVDDAQHVDEASIHLLDKMLRRVAGKRLLIILCSSAEPPSQLRQSTFHVEPMAPEASRDLWHALLEAHATHLPDETSRKCVDAAAGNPGYLELLAQQAAQDPDHFLIPPDLITLTDRRLGQLSAQARFTLEAMVVLDDAASANSVAHLTGLPTYDLLTALHDLEIGGLIVKSTFGLQCRSGLIAERVRATSSPTVTSMMEGRAAAYLENEQSSERWSPSTAWRIASHWQRAGEPRRARAYLRACWQHAVSIGQYARASRAIADALTIESDPQARASLLDDLIGTLQASGDLQAVIPAVSERRSLSSRVHDTPARIAQLAFDEDEASLVQNSNPAAHVDTLLVHLASSLLNPRRRIRAARLVMMAADGELDRSMAAHAIESCEKITPEDPYDRLLQSHVSLIYHAIFGDSDEALLVADDIQTQTQSLERSWYTAMSDRNCAFARQLASPGPSDYSSLERAFAQATDASIVSAALWYAGSITSIAIDDGETARARAWMGAAERLAEQVNPSNFPIDYLSAQVDLSLLSGDTKKARTYLGLMEQCVPRYQSLRLRNELFIYKLRVQLFCSERALPHDCIPRLLEYHEIGKGGTRHDDHMNVLWEALNATGEAELASTLLLDYVLHHRRERRPCRYLLRTRTQSDPAWDQIRLSACASARGPA